MSLFKKAKEVKKMKTKKALCIILAITLCFSFSMHTLAAVKEENIISPYYVNIDGIIPLISENNGDLYASISVATHKTCSVEITLAIQRSTYGTSWANYTSFPKATLNSGYTRLIERIAYDVPTGYYYRTYGIVNVYVNGVLTDSDIVESDPIYVS